MKVSHTTRIRPIFEVEFEVWQNPIVLPSAHSGNQTLFYTITLWLDMATEKYEMIILLFPISDGNHNIEP